MTFPVEARSVLDALDEPALVVRRGQVEIANTAARRVLGSVFEGTDVRLAIRHPEALEHILPGRAATVDVTGIGELGRPWTIAVSEIEPDTVLVTMIDRSAAMAAERMRVDFVANASHELRTPLSTILGYAETLSDDAQADPALCSAFGGVIRNEAQRMLRIIEDLMSLSRIEADRFSAPQERVQLAELMATAVRNSRALAKHGQCELLVAADDGLPPVKGDPAQLLQLLDNLLTNAIRYGCATAGCAVRLSARDAGGGVELIVADDGPGIAAEHLPRLTERFYRVDAARSRDSGGTGLGLAIAKHIVERHRGTLDIRSAPGAGTTVVVRLPAARD